jgi:hypothetical protein
MADKSTPGLKQQAGRISFFRLFGGYVFLNGARGRKLIFFPHEHRP